MLNLFMARRLWSLIFRLSPQRVFLIGLISAGVLGMAHLLRKKDAICPELKEHFVKGRHTMISSASACNAHTVHGNVADCYQQSNYALIWVLPDGSLKPSARALISALDSAWQDGLDPSDYHTTKIKMLCKSPNHTNIDSSLRDCIELDILLTHAFFTYSCDLYAGRLNDERWNFDRRKHLNEINLLDSLKSMASGKPASEILASFSCPHKSYRQLRQLLISYHHKGDTATQQLIALNMERWRWLPRNMPAKYLMANIAGFTLHLTEHEKDTLNMKVIVGKLQQPTPLLTSYIQYLVLNPWWEIPHSIATKEMLPLIQANSSYLPDHHIKVYKVSGTQLIEINTSTIDWNKLSEKNFPYKLRQMPGPWNALGTIKFVFPNRYQVYFHDTPTPELFRQADRTFSHGCVRIEKPIALAAYLLSKNDDWVKRCISANKEQVMKVDQVPVFICYWTVWTDLNGLPAFADDMYGYDRKLQQILSTQQHRALL